MGDIVQAVGDALGGPMNSIIGGHAATDAGNDQKSGIDAAENTMQQMYNTNSPLYNAMIQNGTAANNKASQMAQNGFGLSNFQQDPGYAFNMQQGLNAINNSQSVRGGALSGGAQKALSGYAQQNASNEYQNAYNRFASQQGQLSALGNQGLNAANMNQQYAAGMGSLQTAYGNASADETLGQAAAKEYGWSAGQSGKLGASQTGNLNGLISSLSSMFNSGAASSGTAMTDNSADNAMAMGESEGGANAFGSSISSGYSLDSAFADADAIV